LTSAAIISSTANNALANSTGLYVPKLVVQKDGTQVTAATTAINFTGTGVSSVADSSGTTTVTIAGGGGSGGTTERFQINTLSTQAFDPNGVTSLPTGWSVQSIGTLNIVFTVPAGILIKSVVGWGYNPGSTPAIWRNWLFGSVGYFSYTNAAPTTVTFQITSVPAAFAGNSGTAGILRMDITL
jgi:hypothetical protein